MSKKSYTNKEFIGETEFDQALLIDELSDDPATPASTKWKLYFKPDGLYHIDDAGTVVGPLSSTNRAFVFFMGG